MFKKTLLLIILLSFSQISLADYTCEALCISTTPMLTTYPSNNRYYDVVTNIDSTPFRGATEHNAWQRLNKHCEEGFLAHSPTYSREVFGYSFRSIVTGFIKPNIDNSCNANLVDENTEEIKEKESDNSNTTTIS